MVKVRSSPLRTPTSPEGEREGAALTRDHLDDVVALVGTAGGRTGEDRQRAIHKDDGIVFVGCGQSAGANDRLAGLTHVGGDLVSIFVHIRQLDRSGQLVVAKQVADGVGTRVGESGTVAA